MESKRIIIGITGKASSGKTTIKKIIIEELNRRKFHPEIFIHHFAETIKHMCLILGVPERNLYGTPEQKNEKLPHIGYKSAREIMQTLGTEWGRNLIGDNIWINAWIRQVEHTPNNKNTIILIDDVRFQNELNVVKQFGGHIIRVIGPHEPKTKKFSPQEIHVSEIEMELLTQDQIDYTIDNSNRNIGQPLNKQISLILNEILG